MRRAPHGWGMLHATKPDGQDSYFRLPPPRTMAQSSRVNDAMLPEVFECPQCQRQFVVELVESAADQSIHCPQCKRYLGEKDLNFVLVSEIEELVERLRFERERLERDEAVYSMTDCDAELRTYGNEVHKVVAILRKTVADLDALKQTYR
jgi:Zn finger protein HypA/HybF involved in hydrogenase expression